jgi:poly-D-alanine transfer protein DltD
MRDEHLARRLALLDGVELSEADLESVVREFEDFDRALAELAAFAAGVEFPSMPVQPSWPDHA